MSLDKLLRLANPTVAPEPSELVRAAADDLERIALLLASADEDDDGEGDDEDENDGDDSKGDEDDDTAKSKKGAKGKAGSNNWSKGDKNPAKGKGGDDDAKGGKKMPPWLNKSKKDKVKASRVLVQEAMVALAQLAGGEHLSLSLGQVPTLDSVQTVIRLARGGSDQVAMEHGPMHGEHEHPHRVVNVHSHTHSHNNDSRHACGDQGMMY